MSHKILKMSETARILIGSVGLRWRKGMLGVDVRIEFGDHKGTLVPQDAGRAMAEKRLPSINTSLT
jgi:hypothetical protein